MKGHVRKRGDRSWLVAIYLGKDPAGKKQYHYETVQGTKRDAERRAAELVNEVNQQTFVKPAKFTVGEFLERWLRDSAKSSVRPATYDMYEYVTRVHLTPSLGHIPLDKVTPMALQAFYTERLSTPRADRRDGTLTPTTVRHIHNVLRIALRQAVRWRLLARSPAEDVDPPKITKRPPTVWNTDEVVRFLNMARGDRYYAAYLLAVGAGLRRGEILGLRWQDVDLIQGAVTIHQSLIHTSSGNFIQDPKTAGSRRTVAISPDTVEALRERLLAWRHEKMLEEKVYGPGSYIGTGLIFPGEADKPLDPRSFTRSFERLSRRAGVPRIRFHDLRHTHATLMLAATTHVKVMSERLGHSNISTTMNTYAHVLPSMQRDVAAAVDAILRGDDAETVRH